MLILTHGIVDAQVPNWYTSNTHPQYPKIEYIIGVATGLGATGIDAAKKGAVADIAAQLRVQVQSEMKSVTESFQMNNDDQIYSDFKKQSRTVVNDEIAGAEIIETAVDQTSNTSYALAVLNKVAYSSTLYEELVSGWKQANELRNSAKNFISKGRLNEAIQSISQIKNIIAPLYAKVVLHNAVAKKGFVSEFSFNPNGLQTDIRTMLSQIKIEKKSGDKQSGKVGTKFPQPFFVVVTVTDGGKSVPAVGVAVDFIYDGRTVLGVGNTDENGFAAMVSTVRPMSGDGIRAKVSFSDLGREYEKNLQSSSVTFSWTASPSDKKFNLRINGKSQKIIDALKNKISGVVTKSGYQIDPAAELILNIDATSGISGKVEGMAGTLFSNSIDVDIALIEKTSNTVRGQTKFSAKGVGKTESEAVEKAASALQIGQKEMTELLEK